jgi:hypothetical protein
MDISSGDSLVDLSGHIRLGKLLANVNLVMLFTCMVTELGIGVFANFLLRQVREENNNDTFGISGTKSVSQFLSSQPVYISLVLAPLLIGSVLISPLLFFVSIGKLIGSHLLVSGLIWFVFVYYIPKSFFHEK